jgi:hypothetical protein
LKRKTYAYKNQGQEPIHQKYKAKESVRRHNSKKKQKQTINKKLRKRKPKVLPKVEFETSVTKNKLLSRINPQVLE